MSLVKSDVKLANPTNADLINWNLDMNVTVSNVKSSKIFQRARTSCVCLLALISIFAWTYMTKEVLTLQAQINSMNADIRILVFKCNSLNQSLNRACPHRSTYSLNYRRYFFRPNLQEFHLPPEVNKSYRVSDITTSYSDQTDLSVSDRSIDPQNDAYEKNSNAGLNDVSDTRSITLEKYLTVSPESNRNIVRNVRAILIVDKQNRTTTKNQTEDNELREPRSGRSRRDGRRGKKRQQNGRRPKRSRRRLGPMVATFIGAIPEQHVTDTVYIGPWIKSNKNDSLFAFTKFHLVEDKMSIEVTLTGLYMISVQIFYFGEPTNYSYWILLNSEGVSATQKLIKCATASSRVAAEVSCHTSVITYLQKGDRLRIQQQEKNRYYVSKRIWILRELFIQLVDTLNIFGHFYLYPILEFVLLLIRNQVTQQCTDDEFSSNKALLD